MKHFTFAEKKLIALFLVFALVCIGNHPADGAPTVPIPDAETVTLIKETLTSQDDSRMTVEGEGIYSTLLLRNFYSARDFRPAWSENGKPAQTAMLVEAVKEAYGDGLTPEYYHLNIIQSLVAQTERAAYPDPVRLANLDILLSDAFITLGCHLSGGCVDPVTIKAEWFAKRGQVDVASILEQAIRKKQVREALAALRPMEAAYDNLRQALAKYRVLSLRTTWPQVTSGRTLRKGDVSDRVAQIRKRLVASGDLVSDQSPERVFDARLEAALMTFQKRHGLNPDGAAGRATLAALNVPLERRVRQVELNLERLRWILGNTEQRFIMVNIADFHLDVVENGRPVLTMKVVVGKPYQKTPVFTAKMTYLVINPVWNVPDSIARKEILYKIRKKPLFLSEQNMTVLRGWGEREEVIDPATLDWSQFTENSLPYRFRQEPGPLNPLGRIKFMFPNSYDVYLHDTPSKNLFAKDVRTFSHGCTRIEKPLELAEYLLPDWPREKLLAAMEEGTEQKVTLPRPLNVHFIYLTAWVDENYTLHFRDDVYERDKLLDEVLRNKPSLTGIRPSPRT